MTATASRVTDTTTGRGDGLSREILVLAGLIAVAVVPALLLPRTRHQT
jgi:hypothetical protein